MFHLLSRKTFHYNSHFWSDRNAYNMQAEKRSLISKRPSYRPTGAHPSPKSVLAWRSDTRSSSSLSTSMPILSTHWLLTVNTAPPHWTVTRGTRWLAYRLPCSTSVTTKGSKLWALLVFIRKRESVSLVTTEMTAAAVIPESGLLREDISKAPTPMETRPRTHQIMETNTSKPWDSSWCSDKNGLPVFKAKHLLLFT